MNIFLYLYLLLLSTFHNCICIDLTYHILEGQREDILVGNIADDIDVKNGIRIQDDVQITFHLVKQSTPENVHLFHVDEITGKLYTTQMIDAESLCKQRSKECFKIIEVVARNSQLFIKLIEIKVIIEDVNEYPPQFPNQQIDLQFSEGDFPGTKISIPSAKDRDVGISNSEISYEFKKKDEPFTLHISKNVVGTFDLSIKLEQRLDREVKDFYKVQVIAKDKGTPPKQSILQIRITITDINDNYPTFTKSFYNVSVSNEHNMATPIVIISASDADIGRNGKVYYYPSSESADWFKTQFRVDKTSGEIFLNEKLPVKRWKPIKIFLVATDEGTPPLVSTAVVKVNLIGEQNNAPKIEVISQLAQHRNGFRIREDVHIGSYIAYIKVIDYFNYESQCDLQHEVFQLQVIRANKYQLILRNHLDRELADHHDIMIRCQDKQVPQRQAEKKISFYVEDVNDVSPIPYKETFTFRINENERANISVGLLKATDPDIGDGGKLSYLLLSHDEKFLPFQVIENGHVTTLISLDHELKETYEFKVLVKDHGKPSLNSTVNVIVEIIDENDNAPFFVFPSTDSYKMDVFYHPFHAKNITVLKASDQDSRENAFLKYKIKRGNEKQLFIINPYTGRLSSARALQKEDAGSYELEFMVKDSGSPVLSASTVLILTLRVDNRTTSETAKAVQIQDDDEKMQINLVISITVVSVILSIVITASISVCILRCNASDNDQFYNDVHTPKQCAQDQRCLMYPTYQSTTWPGIYMTIDKSAKGRTTGLKSDVCQGFEINNGPPSMIQPWLPTDIACQMCVQDVTNAPNCENDENTTTMREDFSWINPMSSHAESRKGSDGTDIFAPQCCIQSPPTADKLPQDADREPIQETFSNSSGTNTPKMSFYKKIIDQSELHKERTNQEFATADNDADNINSKSKVPPLKSDSSSNFRPLPPVPNKQF